MPEDSMDAAQLGGADTAEMLAAHDAAALSQYVMTHVWPDARRFLKRTFSRSLNEEDIEDALSVAVARLWRFRASYDPHRAPLGDYFYVIARNAALNILKEKARQKALLAEVARRARARNQVRSAGNVGQRLSLSPSTDAMVRALQDLSPTDQQILLAYALAEGEGPWAVKVG